MDRIQVPRRARELGIVVGSLPPGPLNAVTDVDGVRVGHTTLVEGDSIRTGITAIVPGQLAERPTLPAGLFVGNGHGKMVGSTQLAELGEIETPVLLTATLSTFRVADALLTWVLRQPGRESAQSLNPVVAETNDGFLSDIRARPIRAEHVFAALDTAAGGLPAEGSVGAGTGTGALGFKGGIGTASRLAGRAVFAMARVGSDFAGGSGDYAIAFSTAAPGRPAPEADLEPAFAAVLEATEEALLNSLFMATTTTGFAGHTRHAVPHEGTRRALRS